MPVEGASRCIILLLRPCLLLLGVAAVAAVWPCAALAALLRVTVALIEATVIVIVRVCPAVRRRELVERGVRLDPVALEHGAEKGAGIEEDAVAVAFESAMSLSS